MSPQKNAVNGSRPKSWRPWANALARLAQPSFTPDRQSCRGFRAWRSKRACVGGVPPKVPSARLQHRDQWYTLVFRVAAAVQSAGIDGIETEFVDKLQDDGFGLCIVARNGQGNSTRRSTRPTAFEQMARIDVIKRFDNGPSQFLFDPAAFRHSRLDFYNPAIALARIVVAGIHDDRALWHAGAQPSRQRRNITLRDGDYDQMRTSRGILRLDRDSTSFRHQARKSAGVSGIGHVNLVSQRSQPTGEGAADLTCAYDADFHDLSSGAISLRDQHRRASAPGRASRLRTHRTSPLA